MSKTRAVWFFIAALTLIRLAMLGSTDLEFDEAHYWMWSERLAPAYFSKGPGIAFAIDRRLQCVRDRLGNYDRNQQTKNAGPRFESAKDECGKKNDDK